MICSISHAAALSYSKLEPILLSLESVFKQGWPTSTCANTEPGIFNKDLKILGENRDLLFDLLSISTSENTNFELTSGMVVGTLVTKNYVCNQSALIMATFLKSLNSNKLNSPYPDLYNQFEGVYLAKLKNGVHAFVILVTKNWEWIVIDTWAGKSTVKYIYTKKVDRTQLTKQAFSLSNLGFEIHPQYIHENSVGILNIDNSEHLDTILQGYTVSQAINEFIGDLKTAEEKQLLGQKIEPRFGTGLFRDDKLRYCLLVNDVIENDIKKITPKFRLKYTDIAKTVIYGTVNKPNYSFSDYLQNRLWFTDFKTSSHSEIMNNSVENLDTGYAAYKQLNTLINGRKDELNCLNQIMSQYEDNLVVTARLQISHASWWSD